MAPSLRKGSKFKPFSINLKNGATLTGIAHVPARTECTPTAKPLVVAIHGGKCTCYNFDVDDKHTASLYSAALGIPFIAINRPGYLDSTSFLPLAEGNNYILEMGKWMHNFIFPALWEEFGKPNNCTAIVTNSHSMAVPQSTIAAALYCRESQPQYPWAGMIFSGFGTRWLAREEIMAADGQELRPTVSYAPGVMQLLMLNEEKMQLCDPSVYPLVEKLETDMYIEEVSSVLTWWLEQWKSFAKDINLPILFGLGEFDWLWETTTDHLKEFESSFTACPRFESSIIGSAPHAIEWSNAGAGWFIKCFGWACEATADGVWKKSKAASHL